jgi:predicted permease
VKLLAYLRRAPIERRLNEELETHLDLLAQENIRRGMSPGDARAAARREFGGIEQMKEEHRDQRQSPWLDSLAQDARYAFRQIRRSPGYSALTILTLALGIGVNAAMFTVIDGTLLRPLPYPHPDRLVAVESVGQISTSVSYADVEAWRARSRDLQQAAAYTQFITTIEQNGATEMLMRVNAAPSLFRTLGVEPRAGRAFTERDQQPGAAKVVILSDDLWRTRFHADPNIVGKAIRAGGEMHTVAGIMPRGFVFPSNPGIGVLWMPLVRGPASVGDGVIAIARLKDGVTPAQAAGGLNRLQQQLNREDSKLHAVQRVSLTTYRDTLTKDVRGSLLALDAAVGLVWLIACANVAGLMFARVNTRRHELAIRHAMGAGRVRIARQLLTESLLVSAAAGIAGYGLGQAALYLLHSAFQDQLPVEWDHPLSLFVLLALIGATLVSAVVIGIAPALHAGGVQPQEGLREAGSVRTSAGRSQGRLRDLFVIAEVALSVILLVSAGLMLRSLYAIRQVPLGFRPEKIIQTDFFIPEHRLDGRDAPAVLYQPLLEKLRRIPGVQDAAITSVLPVQANFNSNAEFEFPGRPKAPQGQGPTADLRIVSPNVHELLGIRILRGRPLSAEDTRSSQPVVVVNETFARKYFPGGDPIGTLVHLGDRGPHQNFSIVGVTGDVHQTALNAPPQPEMDMSFAQLAPGDDLYFLMTMFMQLAIRSDRDPQSLIPEVRRTLHEVNPDLAVDDFKTMRQSVDNSLGNQTLAARLLMVFAAVGLLIAAGGLYALLAFAVEQRTHEIGVRVALGAAQSSVYALVLQHAALVTGIGLAAGIGGVLFTGRLLHSFLFGVAEHDWLTLATVIAVLLAAALPATYLPAKRAAQVDPVIALRHE